MFLLRLLVFPFAILYDLVTRVRNTLYDSGLKPSVQFEIPVITVGNLAVGGTGKTPMTEHLIRLLSFDFRVATLSRGYGRKTKGIRIANAKDNASTLGDEPFQFYRKFSERIVVAVGEERALAIPYIVDEHPDTQVVLLDDGFQHRKVRASLSILLTDYHHPFYNDFLLPSGRLRESKQGASRADIVVISKCPVEISDDEMMTMESKVRKISDKPVFFSSIYYTNALPYAPTSAPIGNKVVLVSGIASTKSLEEYVSKNFTLVHHFNFADHHEYSRNDVEKIAAFAAGDPELCVLTTEKDAVKISAPEFASIISGKPFYFLPIEVAFIKNGKDFDEMVLNAVKRA